MKKFIKKLFQGRTKIDMEDWKAVSQVPQEVFPFPKDTWLKVRESVTFGLPKEIVGENESFGDVIECDADAEISLQPSSNTIFLTLNSGMSFRLKKSSQLVIIASDSRARELALEA